MFVVVSGLILSFVCGFNRQRVRCQCLRSSVVPIMVVGVSGVSVHGRRFLSSGSRKSAFKFVFVGVSCVGFLLSSSFAVVVRDCRRSRSSVFPCSFVDVSGFCKRSSAFPFAFNCVAC